MIKKLTPEMIVHDVNKTLSFYESVLGFKKTMSVPEQGVFDWALVEKEGYELMFQTKSSLVKEIPSIEKLPIGNSIMLYIEISKIGELYENIKSKVEIVKEMHNTFYGSREFAIKDCNNYILIFSERK